jgi:hypothetical protein
MNTFFTNLKNILLPAILVLMIAANAKAATTSSHTFTSFNTATITSSAAALDNNLGAPGSASDSFLFYTVTADFAPGSPIANSEWSNQIQMKFTDGTTDYFGYVFPSAGAVGTTAAVSISWSGVMSSVFAGNKNLHVLFFDSNNNSPQFVSSLNNVVVTVYPQPQPSVSFTSFGTGTITGGGAAITTALDISSTTNRDYVFYQVTADFNPGTPSANSEFSALIEMSFTNGSSTTYAAESLPNIGGRQDAIATTISWFGMFQRPFVGGGGNSLKILFRDPNSPYTSSLTNVHVTIFPAPGPKQTLSIGSSGTINGGATSSHTITTSSLPGTPFLFYTLSSNFVPGTPSASSAFSVETQLNLTNGSSLQYTAPTSAMQGATSDANATPLYWSGLLGQSYTGGNGLAYTTSDLNAGFPTNSSLSNITLNLYPAVDASTYTISGSAGIAGATLSYTDGTAKTATADGSGNYSFTVSSGFTGSVTPSLSGYSFSPTSKSYTNVFSDQTGQNYTATPLTSIISGNAGVAGATLSYTDGTAKTATADGSGNYSFTVNNGFTGTVTPSKTGFTFTPANKSYTNVTTNQTIQNYTATAITFTISGTTIVPGATLSWTDGTAKTTTSDGSGNYSITVSYNFSGTVTPSKSGYAFSPANKTYTNLLANQTSQNYAGFVTISGNAALAGATITWSQAGNPTPTIATTDGSGNYSVLAPYNSQGFVTPTATGFTFTPDHIEYPVLLTTPQISQNYTATAITYTISGNVGIAGATLSWTDGTAKTATADGSGNYTFTVSYNFSGTITPSLTGYTFSPTNKTYASVLSDQTNQNYTPTAITYTISGNAGIAGATLSWTDVTAKTATADGSGNYTFTVSYNWSGTVTPSLTGYTFTPASRTYTNVLANQTNQNFTALVNISGNVGIAGATLSWTDGSAKTTTADGSGNYSFTVSYHFTGAVTPSLTGYTFSPASKSYTNISADQTNQNYTALVTISGNAGVPGATLSWTDGTAKTATADGSGNYSFTVSYNFSGTVTPSLAGYLFTPASKTYTNLTANQTSQNYTALVTISGNAGIAGVTLSWTDGSAKTTTADGSGNYSFTVSYNWSGTVTPSLTGFTFNPVNRTYTNIVTNQTNQNYTALVTISGNAGVPGATLSWTDGSAKTTTADGSGNYSFAVTYNFTGTVTPSLTGYSFSPVNNSYTNLISNQSNQNYTALVTISGNAGVPSATLSWTDGTAKTTAADGSGNYSFTVSYNWSGTVTPSLTGYLFSPVSKNYSNVIINQTSQNYTALVTISGNAGAPAVTLSWTDGSAKTTTADGSGIYSFTVPYNWSGTVTPSLTGYTFTPANIAYTNVLVNQTNQNFTAWVPITGNTSAGGVTLTWVDGTAKTFTTDSFGNYSITVPYNWSGTVTPSETGFIFSPASKTYTNVTTHQITIYNASVTIAGNATVAGATLSWNDGSLKTTTTDANGNYSLAVGYGFSGTITPSASGYIFNPTNKNYFSLSTPQTNQNYSALITISGNSGIAGATLSWTDGTAKTATADGSGNYSFTVSYNWTGTVTPSLTGFSFSPANKSYTNVTVNQTSQNYTALVTISGNAGAPGVTLSWTDGTAKTATADGSGNYSFNVTYNFSGTVTPSLTGSTFTPASKTYTNLISNQNNQNYTALLAISGNAGAPGVTLSWTDGTAKTTTADGSGNYSFTITYNWTGTVTPSLTGYLFTPVNKAYTNVLVNQTNQNYTALVTISGNAGIAGATLSWTDGTAKTATADGSGNYSFTVAYNWTGTVTPSLTGYLFTPANKAYANVLVNQTNQNYTALVTISGNAGVPGATLSWTDGTAKTATADGSGNYSFTVTYNWTGTVTPSLTGYLFTPANKAYTNVLVNQTNQNYTALVTISGNAGIAGATLSWTDGTAKTTIANGSGIYSFTVPYNWSGTVTPSLTGYLFTPANKAYTNILVNQTNQNYTSLVTISGNTGIAGATLSWTDGTAKTTIADGSGNYSFTVVYNWTGTVTPSLTGYLFTPANKAYTNVLVNQTNQNYTALVTISGNAGIAGATLSWTDGTAKTTTSDGSGNYSFTVIYHWTGTVTPSLTGYLFTPVNKAYSNILVNQANQNYTALVTISGNAGIAGATLSWVDGTAKTTVSDGSGNYSFTVPYNWSGTVTPAFSGIVFTPLSKTYTNILVNQTNQNYGALITISGNTGIAGAILSWTDGTSKTTTADGNGNYSFTVSYNWSGTVTPAKTGYIFSSTSKTYTNLISNQTSQNYLALVTISGNTQTGHALLSWTDVTSKTAISDSLGNYSFTVSYNWSGTVTISKTGFTFTPVNKVYSGVVSNQTNQNYSATAITFSLSGNAGVGGAILRWTDGTVKTDTADASGNYTFIVSYNWSGTVAPTKTGFNFNPVSKPYTNVISNQVNQNYIATAITFTVSGNAGTSGAILSWSDGTTKADTADVSGNYSFIVSYNWAGTVTVSKAGFTFSPPSRFYTNILLNQTNQNYTATAITFTISGNTGVGGATLNWIDGAAKTTTADSSGNYSFTVSYNFSGNVTPSKTGYTFTPANRTYTNLSSNQVNQNYTATAITFTISGNTGVDGVTLTWRDGANKTVTSDSSGNYTFIVSYNWTGNLNASKTGFTFNPVNKAFSNVISNQLNQNYSASISFAPLAKAATQIASNSFTVNWEKVNGILGYGMDIAADSNFTNILPSYKNLDVDTSSTEKVTGLNSGTKYYFRVRGYYHNLFSGYSDVISVTTLLNTPTNLTAVFDSLGIRLTWDYDFDSTNVNGFVIFREGGPSTSKPKLNKTASFVPIDTVNGHVTTYLDKTAIEGYAYNYSVSAYNLNGIISSIGGSGGGTVKSPVIFPLEKPVNLTGVVQPGGKVVLFWKNKSSTETGSIIQRSTADSTNFSELARISAADTTYTDSAVQSGLKYYYRVAAYRDTIVSGYSNTINVVNVLTGITDLLYGVPKEYQLYQNYPNPFNPTTQIRFALPKQSHVNITIYNILGAVVERLYEGELSAGYHEIHFDASKFSSGIYLYRIIAGTYSKVLKMVLIK